MFSFIHFSDLPCPVAMSSNSVLNLSFSSISESGESLGVRTLDTTLDLDDTIPFSSQEVIEVGELCSEIFVFCILEWNIPLIAEKEYEAEDCEKNCKWRSLLNAVEEAEGPPSKKAKTSDASEAVSSSSGIYVHFC